MNRAGALPRVLREALSSPGASCYRHCDRPIRIRRVPSRLPGVLEVRACPSGVVSVVTYTEWSRRNPTAEVRATLRRWTVPARLVRDWDLRLATRHGPELGRRAERLLAASRPLRPVRVVYWRVYPFRGRDRVERRLFVCFRREHREPVFFAAPSTQSRPECPADTRRARTRPRRRD